MEGSDFKPGLEGVVAFETEIAEPDKEGNALRYRGVDIEELVGHVPYEKVWGLLVDDSFDPGMPRAENVDLPAKTGSAMADLQSATAALAGQWGLKQLIDMTDTEARDDLARLSATMISIVAQSARGRDRVADDDRLEGGHGGRALSPALARGGRPAPCAGDRLLLGLRGRAWRQRLHLHRPHRRLDWRGLRGRHVRGRRRSLRPAPRRRSDPRPQDARRGGGHR